MAVFDVVFEGGGAKGSAFAGALDALYAAGHQTRRLIGTSAGAISATLLAAGYTPSEMLAVVNEKAADGRPRFSGFMDKPHRSDFTEAQIEASDTIGVLASLHLPLAGGEFLVKALLDTPLYPTLFSLAECGGVYAGNAFLHWMTEKLAAKGIAASDTMATMFAKKGVDLSVVTSDTVAPEMLVLNHRTAPDVPVVWAVRMSMSIPLLWQEVVWRDAWGPYLGYSKTGHVCVDGGVLSNFPIRLIADPAPEIMGTTDPYAALNLGLLLDETLPVPGVNPRPPVPVAELGVVRRLSRLMDTMLGTSDSSEIRQHSSEVCRLPVKGCGTTEFDMPDSKLAALVDAARAATEAHLAGRGLARA
jgi:NTE family protein